MSIALIVGLGNPGPRYTATRHNIGFWLVDQIAEQSHKPFRTEAKFYGEVTRFEFSLPPLSQNKQLLNSISKNKQPLTSLSQREVREISPCWLLKPNTFMNRSGQAVAALANYYKIRVEQILVVHDDLDFPAGTVRLKKGGSDCKHNGLKDIIAHLGNKFLRLRFGISHPGHRDDVISYVLNAPTREEQIALETAMSAALEVMPLIVAGEINKAMQQLHTNT